MEGVLVFLVIALLIVLVSLAGLVLVRHFLPPKRLAGIRMWRAMSTP